MKQKDMVNHPDHYQSETGMEVIDVIEAFTFDLKGIEATDTGNVLKYMCRWKNKNGLEDLKKAEWYLKHLINHVEKLEKENSEIIKPEYEFHNPIFGSEEDAISTRSSMIDIAGKFGAVTVADLYDLVGITPVFNDNNYGWVKPLCNLDIKKLISGWQIGFPEPEHLD